MVVFPVRLMSMTMPRFLARCKVACLTVLAVCVFQQFARAEWQRDTNTIAWRAGTNVLWQFSFDSAKGKPFFHPLSTAGGTALTNFKPEDHPWHYGLWFSWKYINKANYWEEDRQSGRAQGATRWNAPKIETHPDGSATILLDVTYTNPTGRVDLAESRGLRISAPTSDGSYSIDWRARFTAGPEGAELDRTPMPGEPNGAVNGGYAGLGLRMVSPPLVMSVVCSTGLVTQFPRDRARPNAAAVGCNFSDGTRDVGGVAIFSDPVNSGESAPWYLINSAQMRFACAAVLAPKIIKLEPRGKLDLHYQITVSPRAWTVETLQAAQAKWLRGNPQR
jgi:hypothetical protein